MQKYNFIKTLTAGVVLAMAFYPQAWACETGYVKGVKTGDCVPASGTCGEGCSYTLDLQGNLNITGNGTGIMSSTAFYGNKDIKNVNISGIKKNGGMSFYGAGAGGGTIKINEPMEYFSAWNGDFSTVDINSSKLETNDNSFNSSVQTIIIPDNLKNNLHYLTFTNSSGNTSARTVNIQCKGNVEKCKSIVAAAKNTLLNNNGTTLNVDFWKGYDEDGNWNEWSEKGLKIYDRDGNPLATYGFDRKLVSSYTYNDDGSVSITDANGKLTGLKNARSITPAQAAALVKKGNHNTVTLTFK